MMPKNPESEQVFGKRVWQEHCRKRDWHGALTSFEVETGVKRKVEQTQAVNLSPILTLLLVFPIDAR
jgi:hypothetical protein